MEENSLLVQWLRTGAFTAEDVGLIPGQGTKILQAVRYSHKQTNKNQDIWRSQVHMQEKKTSPVSIQ